jgi:hypothetical protein
MRAQCGPAIVVEKSSTRRPAKHAVKRLSSFSVIVILVVIPGIPSTFDRPVNLKCTASREKRSSLTNQKASALNCSKLDPFLHDGDLSGATDAKFPRRLCEAWREL